MEDSTSMQKTGPTNAGGIPRKNTIFNSSSPFFESSGVSISASPQDNQSVSTSFLNLVENYRSVTPSGTSLLSGASSATISRQVKDTRDTRQVKDNRPAAPAFSPPFRANSSNIINNTEKTLPVRSQGRSVFPFEKEEPSIIKKHNTDEECDDISSVTSTANNNQGSAIAGGIKEYFNTSLRLAKDSLRNSLQGLN
jgi:hypothetical protein